MSQRYGAGHRQIWHVPFSLLALLDEHVRGVDEHDAKRRSPLVELPWHGDPGPGHPFTASFERLIVADLRNSLLHIRSSKIW